MFWFSTIGILNHADKWKYNKTSSLATAIPAYNSAKSKGTADYYIVPGPCAITPGKDYTKIDQFAFGNLSECGELEVKSVRHGGSH